MSGKKIKVMAGVATVLLLGAVGAWYVVTGTIVKNTDEFLQSIQSKNAEAGPRYSVTYDRITRSPFPSIGARLVNPTYLFEAAGDDSETQPPVKLSMKLEGEAHTITDYLGHAYRYTSRGVSTITIDVGEEHIVATSAPKSWEATIKAKDRTAFQAWNTLDLNDAQQVQAALKDLAQAEFNSGAIRYTDAAGTTLLSSEKAAFRFTNRSVEAGIDVDLALELKGMEAGEAYIQMMDRLMGSVSPRMPIKLSDMPFSVARAGKQDMDVLLSVNLPQGLGAGMIGTGSIDVKKFHVKNNYYSLTAPTYLALREANAQRDVNVKLDWVLDVSAAGAAEGQRMLDMVAQFAPPPSTDAPYDLEDLKQKITAALPTVSTLGPINLKVDLDATAPTGAAGAATPGTTNAGRDTFMLRQFRFGHKRWALEATGESLNDQTAGATINFNLTCKQCDTLTSDVFQTAQGAQEAAALTNPERPQWQLTPELLAQLNSTLAEIGTKDASGDIAFAFTTPTPGAVAVNGTPIAQVLPKLMAVFMAVQPLPEAEAAPKLEEN